MAISLGQGPGSAAGPCRFLPSYRSASELLHSPYASNLPNSQDKARPVSRLCRAHALGLKCVAPAFCRPLSSIYLNFPLNGGCAGTSSLFDPLF